MPAKQIRLLEMEDWEGLYIDGKLVLEGESITLRDFIRSLQAHGACACLDVKFVQVSLEDDEETYLRGSAFKTLAEYKTTTGLT